MRISDRELIVEALSVIIQLEGIGFTQRERDRAQHLVELLEEGEEIIDELRFED